VSGVTNAQLDAIIEPCNGSARQITDAIIELALDVHRSQAGNSSLLASGSTFV
jgi:hypothetical protein